MVIYLIEDSFNPKYKDKSNNKYDILITTDVLAEGINLHRANVLINYDLPWNPTRIMQRVGRVNRVGTEHSEIFVFNFFPTAQSSAQLSLEARVLEKLQAFHDTLRRQKMSRKIDIFKSVLTNSYNHQNFVDFAREIITGLKLGPYDMEVKPFNTFSAFISKYYVVGDFVDPDGNKVGVFSVELFRGESVERARTAQRSFVKTMLENGGYSSALI